MTDRPRRFCMVSTFYPPYSFGGDAMFVRHLSHELAQRGHTIDIIHNVDAYRVLGGVDPPTDRELQHPNITVHALRSRAGRLAPLLMHQTGRPVLLGKRIRQILSRPFDVIHYHNVSLMGAPKILEYGDAVKLYTMHEAWLVCPTHVLFRYNRAPCERPHCVSCTLVHRRPPQWWRYTPLLRKAVEHVDAFISPSEFGIQLHRQRGLDLPYVHLPNFVPDLSESEARSETVADVAGGRPYFLFVGRLEKVKGLHTLLSVFRRFTDAVLVVAGSGGEESKLRRLAEGVDVQFIGRQSAAVLPGLYASAVALIIPSVCYEVFPLVALEAMRQRTPVIARNLGSLPDIVRQSGAGVVYDNDEQLIAAMKRLLRDRDERERFGAAGHAAFAANWTAEVHVRQYLDLIDRLAAQRD